MKFKKGDKVIIHCRKDRKEDIITIFDGKVGNITDIWDIKRNPWGHICVTLDNGCNDCFHENELEIIDEYYGNSMNNKTNLIQNNIKEEKVKAYEIALKTAKKELSIFGEESSIIKQIIYNIFPELEESEDEKLRKSLLAYIKGESKRLDTKKWIDYLEKQKDANKAIEAIEKINKYINENTANAHDMKEHNPDKKYYLGWDDVLNKISEILQDCYNDKEN